MARGATWPALILAINGCNTARAEIGSLQQNCIDQTGLTNTVRELRPPCLVPWDYPDQYGLLLFIRSVDNECGHGGRMCTREGYFSAYELNTQSSTSNVSWLICRTKPTPPGYVLRIFKFQNHRTVCRPQSAD